MDNGRSMVDQVTLLTQDIEDIFQHNEKVGILFLDLTAAHRVAPMTPPETA